MLIKSISFSTYLKIIIDIKNSNIDVFVELEDAQTYTIIIVTVKNIKFLINKEKVNYFKLVYPFIIIKKLIKEIITEAIQAHISDNVYRSKLYHFVGKMYFEKVIKCS